MHVHESHCRCCGGWGELGAWRTSSVLHSCPLRALHMRSVTPLIMRESVLEVREVWNDCSTAQVKVDWPFYTSRTWLGDAGVAGTESEHKSRSSCVNGNSYREAKGSPLCLLLETATHRSLWNRGCIRPLNRPLAKLALPKQTHLLLQLCPTALEKLPLE